MTQVKIVRIPPSRRRQRELLGDAIGEIEMLR